jgi:hypothetical protein
MDAGEASIPGHTVRLSTHIVEIVPDSVVDRVLAMLR